MGSSSSGGGGTQSASVYTVATDQPLPSVISCQITVTGVTIHNSTTNTDDSVFSGSQVIDFAQLSGLHQLMDLNAVEPGTYTSATVTISNPQIGFINAPGGGAEPTVQTVDGTLSMNSVMVTFANPFVLNNADLVGLRMEFDIRQSLATDGSGNITGAVNPVFHMQLLDATNSQVSIDEFLAGYVGASGNGNFMVQGPHGRQWTVETNSSTMFDDSDVPMSSYTTNTILGITGTLDPVSKDIVATEVQVVSNSGFYLGGLFTFINPATGPATSADVYVRDELPAINGISPGDIASLTLNGSEVYRIGHINLPLTTLLFNNSALAAGQRVGVGGTLDTSSGTPVLTPKRVVLRRQGQAGTLAGNVVINSGNNGSFQLTDNWTAGVLLPAPLTVLTTNDTVFINLSGLSALQGAPTTTPVRVVGFIIIDSQLNPPAPVLVARTVEEPTSE
ncbi:MAG: DUF4382 domain-containing protein [Candidatus Acidiferrales bacterium]|jgi:hypothetical protein